VIEYCNLALALCSDKKALFRRAMAHKMRDEWSDAIRDFQRVQSMLTSGSSAASGAEDPLMAVCTRQIAACREKEQHFARREKARFEKAIKEKKTNVLGDLYQDKPDEGESDDSDGLGALRGGGENPCWRAWKSVRNFFRGLCSRRQKTQ
jgi:hypothetical protein